MVSGIALAMAALPVGINLVQAGIRSGGDIGKFWNYANLFSGFGASAPSGALDVVGSVTGCILMGAAGYAIGRSVQTHVDRAWLQKKWDYNVRMVAAKYQPQVTGTLGAIAGNVSSGSDKLVNLMMLTQLANAASTPIRVLTDSALKKAVA